MFIILIFERFSNRIPKKRRIEINNFLACASAAEAGLGLARLPKDFVQDRVDQGLLLEVISDLSVAVGNLYIIYPSRKWMPSKLKVFLSFIDNWISNRAKS